ncbi:hypothetical protein AGMMS4956_01930 [Bacteroidia bacterium]|nr:hypothetical protein AGMMS4956_01930 [Bacteroidia bacterium]
MAGCGTTKVVDSTGKKAIVSDPCEELQQQQPAKRAVGKGTHFKEMTARNIAEAQGRAQFARALSAAVKTATDEQGYSFELYSADAKTGGAVTDQGSKSNDLVSSVANEVVANTVVIKTSKYQLPNDQFEVWVCLEYQKSVAEMAAEVAKKVAQRIPDEQKMKMNFEFDRYRERIEKELEKNQQ